MEPLNLYGLCTLYQTPSKFYIQPCDEPEEALIIDRHNGEITLNQMFSIDFLPRNALSSLIEGIVGFKHLINNAYLIVIKKSSYVGSIGGQQIHRIESTEVIPYRTKGETHGNMATESEWEETYLKMLDCVLKTPHFYFSLTFDLTNSLQRNIDITKTKSASNLKEPYHYYDKRFLWNGHLMSDLDRCGPKAAKYRLPIILGFVGIEENVLVPGINWTLLSRRSVRRAGTRFNTRGIDYDGNVANFVETEQILDRVGHAQTSFVQIRGSIPLMWSQKPQNLKYKPKIIIHNENHEALMRKHIDELQNIYGNTSIVSLIDSSGHEGDLEREFDRCIRNVNQHLELRYHYFDFHKECSKLRWHRLSILIDRLKPELQTYGIYGKSGYSGQRQTGVVRSNCIDSLDRTNVVQSMIARHMIEPQLNFLDRNMSLNVGNAVSAAFMDRFQNVWADNADALSFQYAGTPALKTDFTRTGQRTHDGMLKDGFNSLTRYVSQNFFDDFRQDAIDLFLGNYEGYPSPLYRPLALKSYTSTFPVTIVMLTLVALYFFLRWDNWK